MKYCSKCEIKCLNSMKVCDKCGGNLQNNPPGHAIDFEEDEKDNNNLPAQVEYVYKNHNTNKVVITDINMQFGSMVIFMVKWVLASIPAVIILLIIGFTVSVFFGSLFKGLLGIL